MTQPARVNDRPGSDSPRVLVVDDDRHVLELLEIAFSAHGFRVITAGEGEEAIQRALAERPDLLVLDVRLPKKSGLEVCEALRHHPEEDQVPIILVSAAAETEARLQGLASGADDYLTKPFSPKELIARSRRLLARTAEGREARRRVAELERELRRAQDEAQRAHADSRREQRMRELAFDVGHHLHRGLDLDELARHLLLETRDRLGVGLAALLLPEPPRGTLAPYAIRGDGLDRLAGIIVEPAGALGAILHGLGRPAACRELERLGELRVEVAPLAVAGIAYLAPLPGPEGLEGVLLADERRDGKDLARADLEVFAGLCEVAAVAVRNACRFRAQLDRQIELLCALAQPSAAESALCAEAASLVDRAARATLLPPRERGLLAHGVSLGPWALAREGRSTLEHLAAGDPTGRIRDLTRLCVLAAEPQETVGDPPELERAAALLGIALGIAAARAEGAALGAAFALARRSRVRPLDPASDQALESAVRETVWMENSAA